MSIELKNPGALLRAMTTDDLVLPGWDVLKSPSMHARERRTGVMDVLFVERADLPGVPDYLDRLVAAASEPIAHRRDAPVPTDMRGTLADHIGILSPYQRHLIAERDHGLMRRVRDMIYIRDPRLQRCTLPAISLQLGQLPSAWLRATLAQYTEAEAGQAICGLMIAPDAICQGYGYRWAVRAELNYNLTLEDDALILAHVGFVNGCPVENRSGAKAAPRDIIKLLSGVLTRRSITERLSPLPGNAVDLGLIQIIYHLAAGGTGPPPAMNYCCSSD